MWISLDCIKTQPRPTSVSSSSAAEEFSVIRPSPGAKPVSTTPSRRPRPQDVLRFRRGAPAREKRRRERFLGSPANFRFRPRRLERMVLVASSRLGEPLYVLVCPRRALRRENRRGEVLRFSGKGSMFSGHLRRQSRSSTTVCGSGVGLLSSSLIHFVPKYGLMISMLSGIVEIIELEVES